MQQALIGLYLRTARYYRPSQIAARLRLGMDSLLLRRSPWLRDHRYRVPEVPSKSFRATFLRTSHFIFNSELEKCRDTARLCDKGSFKLLNRTKELGRPIDWKAVDATRLWRYNLHYFDYALDLGLLAHRCNDDHAGKLLGSVLAEWIDGNPLGEDVGWHSYPIARRVVNWIQAVSVASADAVFLDDKAQTTWLKSLYQQVCYLEDHLEFDCLGNHLLADAKALVFAGFFFDGIVAAQWLSSGQKLLWDGLREQILDDGGHYERSPMYHAIVLQDYLEVVLAFHLNGREIPAWVKERLQLMGDFLASITHPDGEIPLFGDSAFGIARHPSDILAAAEAVLECTGRWPSANAGPYCGLLAPEGCSRGGTAECSQKETDSLPSTGYFVLRGTGSGDQMIIDAKPMGPEHVPAHGHCSLFSYELSIAGERLVVDSGVEEYESGPWRQFWRSTRAHNTVLVDGREQSEIWASFRVGRRCRVLDVACIREGLSSLFVGMHDGFAQATKAIYDRRFVAALAGGVWLVLDEITGNGRHAIESLVHFRPEAECVIHDAYAEITLGTMKIRFYPYAATSGSKTRIRYVRGQPDPIQGWYAPEFGKCKANSVLSVCCEATLPARVGYVIAPSVYEITSWDVQYHNVGESIESDVFVYSPQGDIVQHFQRAKQSANSFPSC